MPAASVLVIDCCVFLLSYAFLSPLDCLRKGTVVVVLPCCCHPLLGLAAHLLGNDLIHGLNTQTHLLSW
jgi:hypothetical protein